MGMGEPLDNYDNVAAAVRGKLVWLTSDVNHSYFNAFQCVPLLCTETVYVSVSSRLSFEY